MAKHHAPPEPTYPAWGTFPAGKCERHPVLGWMTPAKRVLGQLLTAEGWMPDISTAEWVSPEGKRARMCMSADGMTAWLGYPVTEDGIGAGPYGTNVITTRDSHKITLVP